MNVHVTNAVAEIDVDPGLPAQNLICVIERLDGLGVKLVRFGSPKG